MGIYVECVGFDCALAAPSLLGDRIKAKDLYRLYNDATDVKAVPHTIKRASHRNVWACLNISILARALVRSSLYPLDWTIRCVAIFFLVCGRFHFFRSINRRREKNPP